MKTLSPPYNDLPVAGRPPKNDAPLFGRRLAAARQKKGLTQAQLAERLNTSQKTIDYYERRAINPSLDLIQKVADALEAPVSELVGGNDKTPRRRPGPASKLQQRFERIKQLPRSEQEFVIKFLDTFLEKS